ncbi:MAG: hypothetical protein LBL74_00925 [Bacteroidales bacterium]|jgi:hypothetical protein|nr:hypothetical protein [Bacteroidales bacterium]
MKRVIFYTIPLIFILTSCYPPRIMYSIENIKPLYEEDSIRVQLIKGNTISTGTTITYTELYLEIFNDRKNDVLIGQNSILELRTDSSCLQYEISKDSLIYQLNSNERKLLRLNFRAMDSDHIAYKTVDWSSIWSFRVRKETNPRHKLFLLLDLQNNDGNKIEKQIILKPIGTKRM